MFGRCKQFTCGSHAHFGLQITNAVAALHQFILQARHMLKSVLDPYSAELLLRAHRGYTQRMLRLYLLQEKRLRISQPSISRWLALHERTVGLTPDEEFRHYELLASLSLTQRQYRRSLARWRGHIEHLRSRGHSLSEIQTDLKQRGVLTSIRSIRRELGAD